MWRVWQRTAELHGGVKCVMPAAIPARGLARRTARRGQRAGPDAAGAPRANGDRVLWCCGQRGCWQCCWWRHYLLAGGGWSHKGRRPTGYSLLQFRILCGPALAQRLASKGATSERSWFLPHPPSDHTNHPQVAPFFQSSRFSLLILSQHDVQSPIPPFTVKALQGEKVRERCV